MTEQFGNGIYLENDIEESGAYQWDLDIDESGDIRGARGIDELQKDVAFKSAQALEGLLGNQLTPTTINRIRATVQDVLEQEDRISRVVRLDVSPIDGSRNSVKVRSEVNTESGVIALVFEVDD